MKYDIFISYSRLDFEKVDRFVTMLQERIPALSIFFDINEIEPGEDEFEEKIITAINEAKNVIFVLSENSMKSKWTKTEITYAQNVKKKVIPILLDSSKFEEGWFLFKFGRVNYIDITSSVQVEKLVNSLSPSMPPINITDDGKKPIKSNRILLYLMVATIIGLTGLALCNKWFKSHPQAVDLGLPTGTLWSSCNLGASNKYEHGLFYKWGETNPIGNPNTYPEEVWEIETIIGTEYDAASKTIGENWTLPTEEQVSELINECDWKWLEKKQGYRVTGRNKKSIFKKSIFIPAAGCYFGNSVHYAKENGYYWIGESNSLNISEAKEFMFTKIERSYFNVRKDVGRSIRPVYTPKK